MLAEHRLVAPGETSIVDDHYGSYRPDRPRRAPRPRTETEKDFLALGPVAEAFLVGAAAAGVSKLATELAEMQPTSGARYRPAAVGVAPGCGIPSLASRRCPIDPGCRGAAPSPQSAGQALVLTLPTVPTRRWRHTRSPIRQG